jgi:hypothetical protein
MIPDFSFSFYYTQLKNSTFLHLRIVVNKYDGRE